MKILLVNCFKNEIARLEKTLEGASEEQDFAEVVSTRNLPIGLMSIKAYLRKYCPDAEIRIVDLNLAFLRHFFERSGEYVVRRNTSTEGISQFLESILNEALQAFQPDIVGLSLLFDTGFYNLIQASRIVKEQNPDILVVAGGHSPHNLYKTLFQSCETVDAVSFGEGEIPWSQLASADCPREFMEQSPYFILREQWDQPGMEPRQAYVENLDEIPRIDYKEMLDEYGELASFYPNRFMYPKDLRYSTVTFFTSRGCTFHCVFCASGSIHGRRIRAYSIRRVKEEIDYLTDVLKINLLSVDDDHFLYDVERAIEIIDYIGSKHVFMEFTSSLAIYPINEKLVEAFVRNHVKVLQLSLESGSQRVLRDIIQKPLNLDKARQVFQMLEKTDIFVIANIVMGFPEETEEDIADAISFLKAVNVHWLNCFSPSPISGSRLLDEALEKGYLSDYDVSKSIVSDNIFINTRIPQERLAHIRYDLNLNINFINNYHIRHGRCEEILERFAGICRKYTNHAFAYYCVYQCLSQMEGKKEERDAVREKYNEIVSSSIYWRTQAQRFGLPLKL